MSQLFGPCCAYVFNVFGRACNGAVSEVSHCKKFISLLYVFAFLCGICSASASAADGGPLLSLGYGRLAVSNISVASHVDSATTEAFDDDDWHLFALSLGWTFSRTGTAILGDLLISESRELNSHMHNAPLVGGGSTKVSSDVAHYGVFIGLRQSVWGFYADLGYGFIAQTRELHYDPPVMNPGTGGDVEVNTIYYGLGFRLTANLKIGLRRYQSLGLIDEGTRPKPVAPDLKATVLHVTFF